MKVQTNRRKHKTSSLGNGVEVTRLTLNQETASPNLASLAPMPTVNMEKRRAIWRAYYYRNKDKCIAQSKKTALKGLKYVNEKKNVPCADCGNKYPPHVMDFDHLPGMEKIGDIASMVRLASREKLDREIAKCEVVCANCHRERSYQRLKNAYGT